MWVHFLTPFPLMTHAIPITATLTAVLGLLLVFLGLNISRHRMKFKIGLGDGGNFVLNKAIRAHGNTAEHAPIFILLTLVYEIVVGSTGFLMGCATVFVLARLLFIYGMFSYTGKRASNPRMYSSSVNYAVQLVLAVALLMQVFVST